ncbi:UNVERIFIED_CONTAM: hypothetical protein Sangu_1674000 [Sesamum angustifolium]|uniref:Uncharacterized protein n=1 Tax=Sesamum angustifolium TaxID=2727405 RepID=A0AAW2MKR7_9LAMI
MGNGDKFRPYKKTKFSKEEYTASAAADYDSHFNEDLDDDLRDGEGKKRDFSKLELKPITRIAHCGPVQMVGFSLRLSPHCINRPMISLSPLLNRFAGIAIMLIGVPMVLFYK